MSDKSKFDYIVVGGGTAGVTIASRLSQYLPTASIALLEAGPNAVDHPNVKNPNNVFDLVGEGLTVDYSTTPQENLNNRNILNLAGRMLSGSSASNVGVWMRASSTDYDLIAEKAGHERFNFKNMVKYFKRAENHWDKSADPEYHGFDGPIRTVGGRKYPLREPIQQSAESMGYKYNPDASKGDPTGLADLTQNFRATSESSSERQHSAKVYDLSKVDIRCESPVARILFDADKRATGVELVSGEKLYVSKEVIISCGAQRTPQTLMLSGIGPKEELLKHNISLLIEAPAVGQNLFDHCSMTQYFGLKNPEKGYALPFQGTMKPEYGQGTPWEFNFFSHIPAHTLAPILSSDNINPKSPEDSSLHPHLRDKRCHYMTMPFYYPILSDMNGYNPSIVFGAGTHIAMTSLNLLPTSRGTITLASPSPTDNPAINPRYLSTKTDQFILRTAVRTLLTLASTPPFSDLLTGETPPAAGDFPALTTASSDEEIDRRLREWTATIAHPMGTCALGTVLDDEFRVKGVSGLRVCDASVFPEPLGAMPSCTIYALAEMCADLVVGREGS